MQPHHRRACRVVPLKRVCGQVSHPLKVSAAQVVQRKTLAVPITEYTSNGRRLLVVFDGALKVAQVTVGETQVIQSNTLAVLVAQRAGNSEMLPVEVHGLVVVAEFGVSESQVAQGNALVLPAPRAARCVRAAGYSAAYPHTPLRWQSPAATGRCHRWVRHRSLPTHISLRWHPALIPHTNRLLR